MNDQDIEEIVADHREWMRLIKENEDKNLQRPERCGKLLGKHEKHNK